jgi:hypothetical protein
MSPAISHNVMKRSTAVGKLTETHRDCWWSATA